MAAASFGGRLGARYPGGLAGARIGCMFRRGALPTGPAVGVPAGVWLEFDGAVEFACLRVQAQAPGQREDIVAGGDVAVATEYVCRGELLDDVVVQGLVGVVDVEGVDVDDHPELEQKGACLERRVGRVAGGVVVVGDSAGTGAAAAVIRFLVRG